MPLLIGLNDRTFPQGECANAVMQVEGQLASLSSIGGRKDHSDVPNRLVGP